MRHQAHTLFDEAACGNDIAFDVLVEGALDGALDAGTSEGAKKGWQTRGGGGGGGGGETQKSMKQLGWENTPESRAAYQKKHEEKLAKIAHRDKMAKQAQARAKKDPLGLSATQLVMAPPMREKKSVGTMKGIPNRGKNPHSYWSEPKKPKRNG